MKKLFYGIGMLVVAISLAGILSCDSGSSSGTTVPDEVAETAASVFSMIGEYLLVEPFPPTTPTGISGSENVGAGERTLTLLNFEPEAGILVSGEIVVNGLNSDPLTISITVDLTSTGTVAATATMNATSTWAAGESYVDDEPSSVSGTFVYNGKSYSINSIMEAIMELE